MQSTSHTTQPYGPFPADDESEEGFVVCEFAARVEARPGEHGVRVRLLSHRASHDLLGGPDTAALATALDGTCDVDGWMYLQFPCDGSFNTEIRIALPPGFVQVMTRSALRDVLMAVIGSMELSAPEYESYFVMPPLGRGERALPA